jgi:ribonuclease HII
LREYNTKLNLSIGGPRIVNVEQMTVVEIAKLLEQNNLSAAIMSNLKKDPRISVSRLLVKWQKRQEQDLIEQQRIQKLYGQERILADKGYNLIAGVDEAGRGPLAGPLVVGAVILPIGCHLPSINDSKKLSAKQREHLYHAIKEVAISVQHKVIDIDVIDHLNIYNATIFGMYNVISELHQKPHAVLIDAVPLPDLEMHSISLIGGDAISASIGAASIIAKVERDNLMIEYDKQFPQYGFAKHKGYGTAEHLKALHEHGPCPIHRKSFEPIKSWGKI